ncbi:preprotein translocase subunit SecE [bacterium]|nr:preprotein translocase subunit SecE [bacterium]
MINFFERIIVFLKESKIELKRVTWPSKRETIKLTLIVIGFSIAVAMFLGTLDFIFTWLMEKFII